MSLYNFGIWQEKSQNAGKEIQYSLQAALYKTRPQDLEPVPSVALQT